MEQHALIRGEPQELAALAAKLVAARSEVGYIKKTGKAEGMNYTFAEAQHLLDKVRTAMDKHGVATASFSEMLKEEQRTFTNSRGDTKTVNVAVVRVTILMVDRDSGAVLPAQGIGMALDAGDKAMPKASTGAIKYAIASAFNVSWGDDPEADPTVDEITGEAKPSGGRAKKTDEEKQAAKDLKARVAGVEKDIAEATSIEALVALKPLIQAFGAENTRKQFESLVETWKAREAALTKEGS